MERSNSMDVSVAASNLMTASAISNPMHLFYLSKENLNVGFKYEPASDKESTREKSARDNDDLTPASLDSQHFFCSQQKIDLFTSLPFEILEVVLSFLELMEIENSVKLTSKLLCDASHALQLWREFCIRTGKIDPHVQLNCFASKGTNVMDVEVSTKSVNLLGANNPYRHLYYSMPCVPVDFPTITRALESFPLGQQNCTVTIMPGVHHENIKITVKSNELLSPREVTIRAAFPQKGAALVHYEGYSRNEEGYLLVTDNYKNQSCIDIFETIDRKGQPREEAKRNQFQKKLLINIENLQILHSTPGCDIWGGNCAIRVDSNCVALSLDSCTLQSDSGRGVVVTNGAQLSMRKTVIHDCAATGLYVGDIGSQAYIYKCNIIRNGDGSRRISDSERRYRDLSGDIEHEEDGDSYEDDDEEDVIMNEENAESFDDRFESVLFNNFIPPALLYESVPPGHSGMYVETGTAIIEDSLLAANSLTGLSVVRGGRVQISRCDIADNGAEPVTVQDAHDLHLGADESRLAAVRGGIIDSGENNYNTIHPSDPGYCRRNLYTAWITFGRFVRQTQFPCVITKFMTEKRLSSSHF